MGTLNIDILGTSFSIEAKEDNEYLETLLAYYTQVTKEVKLMSRNTDPKKVAILSGIMICDELFKDRAKAEEIKKHLETNTTNEHVNTSDLHEAERITLKMIQDLDRIIS